MPTHSSQIGLVLQNGFVFLGGNFSQMGLCAEQLYKIVLFFQKNEKLVFLINTTKWFYIFLGFGQRLGLALQNGFSTFQKTTDTSTKWFAVFWGKCKLIDSKMIEPYSMVYKIPGNLKISEVISTKWFVK